MDPLEELITWATAKGVKLNGIKPARMPGRGVGIVATRQVTVSPFPVPPFASIPASST